MVLRLGEALGVGLRESNHLLHAAGLPATYPQSDIGSPELAPYRAAIDRMLQAHEPYPAMVIDDRWNVVLANCACSVLFGTDVVGMNFVRDYLANPASAQTVVNWPEVSWAGMERLRQQSGRAPFDKELSALVALAKRALSDVARPSTFEAGLTVCPPVPSWGSRGEHHRDGRPVRPRRRGDPRRAAHRADVPAGLCSRAVLPGAPAAAGAAQQSVAGPPEGIAGPVHPHGPGHSRILV